MHILVAASFSLRLSDMWFQYVTQPKKAAATMCFYVKIQQEVVYSPRPPLLERGGKQVLLLGQEDINHMPPLDVKRGQGGVRINLLD